MVWLRFSLYIIKKRVLLEGNICFMSCASFSSFLYYCFQIILRSYHFLFFYFIFFIFLLRESEKKRKKDTEMEGRVSKGEKRGRKKKVYGLFLSCCFPLS